VEGDNTPLYIAEVLMNEAVLHGVLVNIKHRDNLILPFNWIGCSV
jgi:hypothetical protein